ncbi:hypothetical protein [Desulfofundulus thermosubterraneus]|uniref:DUF2508 domain-containing protein n=1 Tax=Desulfofundulus thermosubterraneus DSM 16057 TaxID=1121432 RepID=A0A1M6KL52_9FIRM|nr:hypothetical protein [Desulfofundulus thermosubterraneus]SHJ59659.1 hypothetical protein SAMN02745219_02908 [Desulfofundulus thermosubterraneus DSM 16057]
MQAVAVTWDEVRAALEAVEAARQRLDYADHPDLVDAAVLEMGAAEKRLNYLLRVARQNGGMSRGKDLYCR